MVAESRPSAASRSLKASPHSPGALHSESGLSVSSRSLSKGTAFSAALARWSLTLRIDREIEKCAFAQSQSPGTTSAGPQKEWRRTPSGNGPSLLRTSTILPQALTQCRDTGLLSSLASLNCWTSKSVCSSNEVCRRTRGVLSRPHSPRPARGFASRAARRDASHRSVRSRRYQGCRPKFGTTRHRVGSTSSTLSSSHSACTAGQSCSQHPFTATASTPDLALAFRNTKSRFESKTGNWRWQCASKNLGLCSGLDIES